MIVKSGGPRCAGGVGGSLRNRSVGSEKPTDPPRPGRAEKIFNIQGLLRLCQGTFTQHIWVLSTGTESIFRACGALFFNSSLFYNLRVLYSQRIIYCMFQRFVICEKIPCAFPCFCVFTSAIFHSYTTTLQIPKFIKRDLVLKVHPSIKITGFSSWLQVQFYITVGVAVLNYPAEIH